MTADDTDITELEAALDDHRQRLDDHEAVLEDRRRDSDDAGSDRAAAGPAVGAGGLLAAVGLGAGTASAEPQGQVGADGRAVETVYVAALDGPVTNDQPIESLVGGGLEIEDGTLTIAGGN